jgi:hypothetical protein
VLAIVALALLCVSESHGQALNRKSLPTLSLVKMFPIGGVPGGDVSARDTQYVSEPGAGERRYFLLPIFIKNCLNPETDPISGFPGERLYSFRFKLQYNRTLLRAIGVQKRGSLPYDTNVVAKNFNLSWDIDQDLTYKTSTVGGASANGERIMVTGSSSIPLPRTESTVPNRLDCQFRDTSVFLYVLFEVVGTAQGGTSGANRDQLILTRDSIRWNDYGTTVDQKMLNRGFEPYQAGVAPSPIIPITYPNNYGSAVIQITQRPRIDLFPANQVAKVNGDQTNYEVLFPLSTTFGNPNRVFRNLLLVNGVAGAYLRNLVIETDQPWLRIDTNDPNIAPGVGQGGGGGERGVYIRQIGQQQNINIVANPAFLPVPNNDYPTPGIYTGYVTIRSIDALNSAVRVKVTLIVYRNPLEDQLNPNQEPTRTRGIQLLVRNSAINPDTTYLTFGTGIGATTGIDTLFGEAEARTAPNPNQFFARFFPFDSVDTDNDGIFDREFKGMGDLRGALTQTPLGTINENSIDIRDYQTNTTLVYCVKFSAGATFNYPVVIEYDTTDFPNGAQLFIRDNVNGLGFSGNLREATSLGGSRKAFFIRDPNSRGFCIEYTLPRVMQFPDVKRGWNLISLPVRPSDNRSSVVFPHALIKPARFAAGTYVYDDTVAVGHGYFIKYGQLVDSTVAGVPVREIHENRAPFYRVPVYQGWNTVGALSVPTTTALMSFGPPDVGNLGAPKLVADIYRYITDRGYEQVSRIDPGLGYWIKLNGPGYYRLAAPPGSFPKAPAIDDAYKALNRLEIADNSQKLGTLYFGLNTIGLDVARYELPPVPGNGLFDVRFANNGMVSASENVEAGHVVNITGVTYPLVLSVANADADYVVTDAVTGQVLGSFTKGEAGAVRITNPMTKSVRLSGVASTTMNLGAAFPNPASGRVSFDFTLPTEEYVAISLYNSIGQEVKELFRGRTSGTQVVEFSAENLTPGAYYYRMTTAAGISQVRQIVISK